MLKSPLAKLSLFFYPVAVLWLGLGILYLQGKDVHSFVWQAAMFSIVLLAYVVLSLLLGYRGDSLLLPAVSCLLAVGLVILARINPDLARRQFLWATFGVAVVAACLWGLKDYRRLARYQYIWALLAVVMLFVTLFFGVSSGGARSWFRLGPISVEPEELVKVAMIIFLANYLQTNRELLAIGTIPVWRFSVPEPRVLGPLAMMVGVSLMLLAAQKSLGTALVFFGVALFMIYLATGKGTYLFLGLPVFLATGFAGYQLFGHVRTRVAIWLDPWQSIYGSGNQIVQGLFAIGGGGMFGMGLGGGFGAAKIPEAESDFVFAVIAEELGFIGALVIILLFILIIYRCFVIALRANDEFGTILAGGIGFLFGFEALIILAGVIKVLPLTGIPLPWVSYGGNSLLVHMFLIGCLNNISHVSAQTPVPGSSKLERGWRNEHEY